MRTKHSRTAAALSAVAAGSAAGSSPAVTTRTSGSAAAGSAASSPGSGTVTVATRTSGSHGTSGSSGTLWGGFVTAGERARQDPHQRRRPRWRRPAPIAAMKRVAVITSSPDRLSVALLSLAGFPRIVRQG
jgi:hypothetical protein